MKRIVVGLLAAFLTMAGLVAVSSSPATAACPYTNCARTNLSSEGPKIIRKGKQVTIKIGVRAAGNVAPRGTVKLTYYKVGKPRPVRTQIKTVRPVGSPANKSATTFKTPKLAPGKYRIRMKFTPQAGTVFKASTVKTRPLTVRNR